MRSGVAATNITSENQVSLNILTHFSIDYSAVGESIIPADDSVQVLGSATKRWAVIHADDAGGGLKALIMMGI